jgi:mono/diheme cytochrome c family protein
LAVTVFILTWILLGVGLLFIALSGGPTGARERLQSQSRGGRRFAFVGFALALLLLGVALPAAIIAQVKDRNDVPKANVANLTAREQQGRTLFGDRCRNCHSLAAANATAKVGPNLDQLRPPKNLVLDAIENGRARGNGQMAADLVEGEDAEAVAAFVAKAVGQTGK